MTDHNNPIVEFTDSEKDSEAVQSSNLPTSGREAKGRGKEEKPEKRGIFGELLEWVKIICFAAAAAFLLNHFVIANSTIPTSSMENTIEAPARVFGLRLAYRFGKPKRDDIAIFVYGYTCRSNGQNYRDNDPETGALSGTESESQKNGLCPYDGTPNAKNKPVYYVKRIIGMPGDHIEIRKTGEVDPSEIKKIAVGAGVSRVPVGTVYVNGTPKEELYLPEPMIVDGSQFPEVDITVPEGAYYVLGDNRNNSMDARYWGDNIFVPQDKMVAKVYFQYWPLRDAGLLH